jgi:drug/metabolite transporter (DMT)-like permease
VCVVVSLTAIWEAVAAGRSGSWLDLAGYGAMALSGVLFAVQAILTPRRPDAGERLQAPAVFLTIVGVFLLLISPSAGPRL